MDPAPPRRPLRWRTMSDEERVELSRQARQAGAERAQAMIEYKRIYGHYPNNEEEYKKFVSKITH